MHYNAKMNYWKLKRWLVKNQVETIRRFYRNWRFALIDLLLGFFSLFSNPYRTCRKFLQRRGEKEIYAYGETPLATLEKIAVECALRPQDHFVELGSGRGKSCFWVSQFIGCRVTGIEWVPSFIRLSRFIKALFQIDRLSFQLADFKRADLSQATFVYLYGTCLSEEQIRTVAQSMEKLPNNGKIVSISFPLESRYLKLQKSFPVAFPWGETVAYLSTATKNLLNKT